MRWYWKLAIALGFVGTAAMAAAAFGQTGSPSPTSPPSAQAQEQQGRVPPALRRLGNRVVHGELKLRTQDGFATVVIDTGTVTAVDQSAQTLTIKRADGQSVTVTAIDKTRVRKDGEKASFADIKTGDLAQVIRVDRGSGLVVVLIRDRSAGSTSGMATSAEALAGVL